MKVMLVVVDTLRADHLNCYGYHRKTSPNIDAFASEGVLFSRAYPSDVPTQPSFTAMSTGQRGINTGIVSHSPTEELRDDVPFLPEILAGHGYTTAAASTLYIMRKWFVRGFHVYMNPVAGTPTRIQQVDANEINDVALPWIKRNRNRDFFMFVHYWDPHGLYIPPERYRGLWYEGDPTDPNNHSLDVLKKQVLWPFAYRHLRVMRDATNLDRDITDIEYVVAQYDGEIAFVDEKFGELMHALEEVGIADDTMIILTSDHGESLGEHHFYFDHADVYEPTIHVPLVIRYPRLFPKGKRIDALVQLIDIPFTILDTLKIPTPSQFEGRSLLPLLRGETEKGYSKIYSNQGLWSAKRTVIAKDGWKLIKTIDPGFWETPAMELYNLNKDPGENRNLADEERDILDKLELQMQRWLETKLKKRPDPVKLIASTGLPPLKWVERAGRQFEAGATYEELRKRMGY